MNWYVLRLRDPDLAVKTMIRLDLAHAYPMAKIRRPRRPDLVEPMLRGYALARFDPAQPIRLRFWREGTDYYREVPWQGLGDIPGVSRVFHDGRRPLPVLGMSKELRRALGEDIDLEEPAEVLLPPRFEKGQQARILDGPFTSFFATIERAVDGVWKAQVDIFGRTCPAEFTDGQLEAA